MSRPTSTMQPDNGQGRSPEGNGVKPERVRKRSIRPIPLLIGLIVVIIGMIFGMRWYRYNSAHQGTDDAQVSGDIYSISPQVQGYVLDVAASTNQFVHRGDLLVRIDPRHYQQAVEQAQANLRSLQAAAAASGSQVSVTRQTSTAGTEQAVAALNAARAGVDAASTKVATARAQVLAAREAIQSALAGQQAAEDAIKAAHAQVEAAHSAIGSSQASEVAVEANQKNAAANARRYQTLYQEGAISAQQYDASEAAVATANAQVQQAQQEVQVNQARYSQALAAEQSSRSAAAQAATAVQEARAGLMQAQDQVAQTLAGVSQAQAQVGQSQAGLLSAESAPAQVSVSASNAASNAAKIAQAKAALDQAELELSYCEVRSPADGYISEKNVEPGQLVQPGQALMAVVPLTGTNIEANFKETQLTKIQIGQPAEITVDAYPGRVFRGKVLSIASATGATFSLLPPENAAGNFVKVVQRVPVKISIDESSDPEHLLRLGMSVSVTVTTG